MNSNKSSSIDERYLSEFISAFCAEFNLMLFGLDIVISESGKHHIIDCNYFSSYTEFDEDLLATKFEELIEFIETK